MLRSVLAERPSNSQKLVTQEHKSGEIRQKKRTGLQESWKGGQRATRKKEKWLVSNRRGNRQTKRSIRPTGRRTCMHNKEGEISGGVTPTRGGGPRMRKEGLRVTKFTRSFWSESPVDTSNIVKGGY